MAAVGSVANFYKNKSVLITGSTGSLGKILIEKLLRSCSGITHIYLLVRPTKSSSCSASERLSDLLNSPIFSKLHEEDDDIFKKIVLLPGDLSLPDIGISESDKVTLVNNVSIVLHCAAQLKFDSSLKDIISNNVFGTLRLLQLCHQMKKIKAFIYVSTLYSTCNHTNIKECLPLIPYFNGVMDYNEINEDEFVNLMPQKLVDQWPNTYTFSKAITEVMLDKHKHKHSVPISIVRPSIILSTLREPIPGWIDNFYGPTLMICNTAIGLKRSLHGLEDNVANIIPPDMVVNLIICAGWKTAKQTSREITIYNCCSGKRNPLKWSHLLQQCLKYAKIYPFKNMVRYPHTIFTTSYYFYRIISAIQEYLVAYIHRIIIPNSKMLSIQRSLTRMWKLVSYFPNHEWTIDDHNVVELNSELNKIDRETFLIDVEEINWSTYLENYAKGIRIHLLKDSMDSIDEGRARLNTLYWREILIQVVLLLVMIIPASLIVGWIMY